MNKIYRIASILFAIVAAGSATIAHTLPEVSAQNARTAGLTLVGIACLRNDNLPSQGAGITALVLAGIDSGIFKTIKNKAMELVNNTAQSPAAKNNAPQLTNTPVPAQPEKSPLLAQP